jgi:hypothetical protein
MVVDNPTSPGHLSSERTLLPSSSSSVGNEHVLGEGYKHVDVRPPTAAGAVAAATRARIDIEIALRRTHNEQLASCAKDEAGNVRGAERIVRDLEQHRSRLRSSLRDVRDLQTRMVERASSLDEVIKVQA